MKFNASKCKSMHLGSSNSRHVYTMDDHSLEQVRQERDLGVIVDEQLKFHQQTAASVSKANQILGVIRKSFEVLDKVSLPLLLKSLVRPHLEYCNSVWGPNYRMDQQAVEGVQRRATKLVFSLRSLPYQERITRLCLPSLQYRRRRGDRIQVFNVINGIDRMDPDVFFTSSNTVSTRGHHLKLFKHRTNKDVRKFSFSQRIINDWNSLPESVRRNYLKLSTLCRRRRRSCSISL